MLKDFSTEAFDVIVQAGQSNAEGCGYGSAEEPYEPNPDILYLTRDFMIVPAVETVHGNEIWGDFSLSFSSMYVKAGLLQEGRKLLILRCAVGGAGFSDHRWGAEDDLFLTMMEMIKTALGMNNENRLVAFLWHQGEHDACNLMPPETYRGHLAHLISLVRSVHHCPELPFIAGDFAAQWKYWAFNFAIPIADAVQVVCQSDGHAAFVESTGLKSNNQQTGADDIIHFCRDSLNQLGRRYFEAFQALKNM